MERRALGRSGIDLPVIGFGCGPNARLMVGEDEQLRTDTVRHAIDLGIDYFDTAYAYGWGVSEYHLGRALHELGARPTISTKFCLQPEDLKDPRSAVLKGFEESLERLGADSVDVLLAHNRIAYDHEDGEMNHVGALLNLHEVFNKNGIAVALQELLDAKVIRASGLTAYGGDPAAVAEALAAGVFGSINASYSLLNTSAATPVAPGFDGADYEQVIATAASFGVGVMAIQALGRGVLASAERPDDRVVRLRELARGRDETLVTMAIRYVLSTPGVTTVILGLSEPRHVDEAVEAAALGPYSLDDMEAIERELRIGAS